jgi:hypothetical protein
VPLTFSRLDNACIFYLAYGDASYNGAGNIESHRIRLFATPGSLGQLSTSRYWLPGMNGVGVKMFDAQAEFIIMPAT